MPNVVIHLKAGRDIEKKRKLHAAVTHAVADSLGIDIKKVRVELIEMQPGNLSYAGEMED